MRRLYTVDEVQDLMYEAASASVPVWRRWRANRILGRLPEAVHRQAAFVARHRLDQALRKLSERYAGETGMAGYHAHDTTAHYPAAPLCPVHTETEGYGVGMGRRGEERGRRVRVWGCGLREIL
jgi:hypothetical protein